MKNLPGRLKKYCIKTYGEVFERVDERLRRAIITPPPGLRRDKIARLKNTLLGKLAIAYNIVSEELSRIIEAVEEIEESYLFYKELFRQYTGVDPGMAAKKLRITRRNLRRVYAMYRQNIKNSYTGTEAAGYFKTGLGRILSFYKRNNLLIESIKKVVVEITRLPDVSGDLVVIISGMPQVGKSTIIKKLTRAEPEIGNYPFTTKNIMVGHIEAGPEGKITLVDTPGLLDRPAEERNEIENRAVLALKYLADKALYIFDPSPQSYYSLRNQLRVYEEVEALVGTMNIQPIINKIDITPQERLEEYIEHIRGETGKDPLLISALRGNGLGELRELMIKWLKEKNLSRKQ